MKKTKVHTILFTEECPLECLYCNLKTSPSFGTMPPLREEEIFKAIEIIDEKDDKELVTSRLLLTGGEPFLYPDLIKKIILKYGNRFQYAFNTSGMLLTKEMLVFLSNYRVHFVLSVDGGEKLTNYLRPNITNKYRVGYFKRLKEIVPTLLYYYPQTPFRMIVNPRYVDLLHEQYLIAEQTGFKKVSIVLDFQTRRSAEDEGHNKILWSEEYQQVLKEQLGKIATDILWGFANNLQKPQVVELNNLLQSLSKEKVFSADSLECQVFAGRGLTTLYTKKEAYCMSSIFPNMEDAKQAIEAEFLSHNGKCPRDASCELFTHCALKGCPKNAYELEGSFFFVEELECILNKILYKTGIFLLQTGSEICQNSTLYKYYLQQLGFGKEANS